MKWLYPRHSRLEIESAEVMRLAREFRGHMREFENADDPFVAITRRMASNSYESRQEANIWRGPPR